MSPDKKKLLRLHRLEQLRAHAKSAAIAESAQAEGTLARLLDLALRTGALAADYAARTNSRDGAELSHTGRFAAGLQGVRTQAEADAIRARALADQRARELAQAERSRAAIEQRAVELARALAQAATARDLIVAATRRQRPGSRLGTDLDYPSAPPGSTGSP